MYPFDFVIRETIWVTQHTGSDGQALWYFVLKWPYYIVTMSHGAWNGIDLVFKYILGKLVKVIKTMDLSQTISFDVYEKTRDNSCDLCNEEKQVNARGSGYIIIKCQVIF